jgi:Ca2+-transporting ATPase
VVLNAIIGFYQEFSAEKSIAALKKMSAPRATVRRSGKQMSLPAAEVVPGDILVLEAGDLVAADARLLEANSLRTVEAALTGESQPVDKDAQALMGEDLPLGDRKNMVFMGTHVAAGTGAAVVAGTGMNTELGHIATLLEGAAAAETTPLQQKLDRFGRVLVWVALGIVTLLFVLGLLRRMEITELLLTSISLAVATVPEGLPAVVTIALALGVMRMAKRRALVRRLPAVETLGSTNVICTDKTGTLTLGQMTVRELFVAGETFHVTGEGYAPEGAVLRGDAPISPKHAEDLLELANVLIGSNNASLRPEKHGWTVVGDPTEGALLAAGHKAGANKERLEREFPRVHEIPFDSERKRRTVLRRLPDGRLRAYINGAPDVLLQLSDKILSSSGVRTLTDTDCDPIMRKNTEMADRALRVLGSAYHDVDNGAPEELTADKVEHGLTFVGLAGMYDPPRAEAKAAVADCRGAGIRVVMITGDHPHTARAIARELGIASADEEVLSGIDLQVLTEDGLKGRVPRTAVYARVSAEHKLRIVRAWKAHGAVVAMTGDGVNDAPALKGADIGIAMGRTGTEVTKEAADMIVTDDNFASIVAAVEEGRGIFDNIRKTLQYLLASNAGELFVMATAIILGVPMPLLPIHLLWINLVTDGPPALALAADPIEHDVMRRPPRPATDSISGAGFFGSIAFTGIIMGSVALAIFYYTLRNASLEMARTQAFATLVFSQLFLSFAFRSETKPFWRMNLFGNPKLLATILLSSALQLAIFRVEPLANLLNCSTLPWSDLLWVVLFSSVPFAFVEARKALFNQRKSATH